MATGPPSEATFCNSINEILKFYLHLTKLYINKMYGVYNTLSGLNKDFNYCVHFYRLLLVQHGFCYRVDIHKLPEAVRVCL